MSRKDVIASVLIGVVIAVALAGSALLWARSNEISRNISCTSAQYNHQQLTALAQIAHRLGVPQDFTIEPVPPECDGR